MKSDKSFKLLLLVMFIALQVFIFLPQFCGNKVHAQQNTSVSQTTQEDQSNQPGRVSGRMSPKEYEDMKVIVIVFLVVVVIITVVGTIYKAHRMKMTYKYIKENHINPLLGAFMLMHEEEIDKSNNDKQWRDGYNDKI